MLAFAGSPDGRAPRTTASGRHPASTPRTSRSRSAGRGVRSSVVRLAPTVHSSLDHHGFVPQLILSARKNGFAAYVGEGKNRWPAADAARLYRLALKTAPAGSRLHGADDEGVPFREIAEAIGRGLGLPASSVEPANASKYLALSPPSRSSTTQRRAPGPGEAAPLAANPRRAARGHRRGPLLRDGVMTEAGPFWILGATGRTGSGDASPLRASSSSSAALRDAPSRACERRVEPGRLYLRGVALGAFEERARRRRRGLRSPPTGRARAWGSTCAAPLRVLPYLTTGGEPKARGDEEPVSRDSPLFEERPRARTPSAWTSPRQVPGAPARPPRMMREAPQDPARSCGGMAFDGLAPCRRQPELATAGRPETGTPRR